MQDGSEIYTATRASVFEPWLDVQRLETCLPAGQDDQDCTNDPGQAQSRASLSRDGSRLYFGSTRADAILGGAGSDTYVATRPGPGKRRATSRGEPRK